ncbi:MAG: DUF3576 domain-containing protein [Alphaproteobacteria bacterium]|nr:DUF3576 domain-containing protein [Alphaproteobacteria bacterium]
MRNLPLLVGSLLALAGCAASAPAEREMGTDGVTPTAPQTLGVNAYLWQAALETLSFLPLESSDPFGGVILSGWYGPPNSPDERIKVAIHIMDRALRAEGLKVAVFRQVRAGADWRNALANPDTAHQLEDAILTRARALRMAALAPH